MSFPSLKASSWIPFTSLTTSASGFPGEKPSFGFGPSRRQRHFRCFLLGGDALELLFFVYSWLLVCPCCFPVGQEGARHWGRCGSWSGGSGIRLCFWCWLWSLGWQGQRHVGCTTSGLAWMSERRHRISSALQVLALVAWAAGPTTCRIRRLGAGVDVGAAAPDLLLLA
jgi:hypothetical protein